MRSVVRDRETVVPYDFRSHDVLDRARLRRLNPLLVVMTHRMAGTLTSALRQSVHVSLAETRQERWEEFVNALPEPTFLASAPVQPFGGRVVLHVPSALALALVDLRLGGDGRPPAAERGLTEIEHRLVSEMAAALLAEIPPALRSVLPIELGQPTSTSSGVLVQVGRQSETWVFLELRLVAGEQAEGSLTLCLPVAVLLPVFEALERAEQEDHAGRDSDVRERLLEVPVEVRVVFPDTRLTPLEVLSLAPGDVLSLRHDPTEPLALMVGGLRLAPVRPITRGKRLACEILGDIHPEEVAT
jgi:flagellar motor switch protein FliM